MQPFTGPKWQMPPCGLWGWTTLSMFSTECPTRKLACPHWMFSQAQGNHNDAFMICMCGDPQLTCWTNRLLMARNCPVGNPRVSGLCLLESPTSTLLPHPRVLNPRTRTITTPYHVVFDDWFATVGSAPAELPDFQSPEWHTMFGDSEYQYVEDESWNEDSPFASPNHEQMFERRELVAQGLTQKYQTAPPESQPGTPIDGQHVPLPMLQAPEEPRAVDQRENLWSTPRSTPPPPLFNCLLFLQ